MNCKKITVSVCIPSIKKREIVQEQIDQINNCKSDFDFEVFAVCKIQSAPLNRNECIDAAEGDIIIQCDDDITGYYDYWIDDLIEPLIHYPSKFSIVAARCLDKKGNLAGMLGDCGKKEITGDWQKAIHTEKTMLNICCSATIAFYKHDGIRFDNDYKSAVYEDTQFSMDYKKKFPERDIIINNNCKLIHLNEMKRLDPHDVMKNSKIFAEKNGIRI